MFKLEDKFINFIINRKELFLLFVVTIIAIFIRVIGFDVISGDMRNFLMPWYNSFAAQGGINALSHGVGNYNLLYQTVISILSIIGNNTTINSVVLYKIFSIIFDFALAISIMFGISYLKNCKLLSLDCCLGYSVVLLMPTVILNSSYWGQCDSVYTVFLLLTFLALLKERYVRAFIYFGVALAFKLQALFILPFLICYYLCKRKFSALLFFIPVLVLWLSGILAYINGADLFTVFKIYFDQIDTYHEMYLGFYSFWVLVGNDYEILKNFAIMLTAGICAIGTYSIVSCKKYFESKESILSVLCWFLWTVLLFLPGMHDRYAYPLDIFLILLAFTNKKYIKYAVLSATLSTTVYGNFLFSQAFVHEYSLLYLLFYVHFSQTIFSTSELSTNAENL